MGVLWVWMNLVGWIQGRSQKKTSNAPRILIFGKHQKKMDQAWKLLPRPRFSTFFFRGEEGQVGVNGWVVDLGKLAFWTPKSWRFGSDDFPDFNWGGFLSLNQLGVKFSGAVVSRSLEMTTKHFENPNQPEKKQTTPIFHTAKKIVVNWLKF